MNKTETVKDTKNGRIKRRMEDEEVRKEGGLITRGKIESNGKQERERERGRRMESFSRMEIKAQK